MRILTIEITRVKFYFLLLLLITSCQKDYYLDDLNDALDQVNTLRSEKSQLESQLNQIQALLNQSNNTISQLESAYSHLQTSYDNLYQDFINERSTVAELKDLIVFIELNDSDNFDVRCPNPICVFFDIFLNLFPILLIG